MKMDIHSLSQHVIDLWNEYELNAMILLSLFFQIFLVVSGNKRKYVAAKWLRISIWLAYLSADWVATFSLGILARGQGESDKNGATHNSNLIPAFWAPILLVHLGGPDTITANSLEDNELWLRHLLELVTQVVIAFYALFRSWWSKDPLIFVVIPIFISGLIKYGERNWVLRLASSDTFRTSENREMHPLRKKLAEFENHRFFDMSIETLNISLGFNTMITEAKFLHEAHLLFVMFKVLYAGHVLHDFDHLASYLMLRNKSATEAFKLTEVGLGFMFDVLYTKLFKIQSSRLIFRAISFLSSVSALLAFSVGLSTINNPYSTTTLTLSCILLVGGMVLEIHSAIVLFLSDWAMLWISKQKKPFVNFICRIIFSFSCNRKRWIDSVPQHNLLKAQLIEKRKENGFTSLIGSSHIQSWEDMSTELKKLIFDELLDKRLRYSLQMRTHDPGKNDLTEILAERGGQVLEREGCPVDFVWRPDIDRSVKHSDFNQSILTWHVATDICYYDDVRKNGHDANQVPPNCKMSRTLSNYMLYLLRDCPFLLPAGIGEERYEVTCVDVSMFDGCFRGLISGEDDDWRSENTFYEFDQKAPNVADLGGSCKLARALQSLESDHDWDNNRKWVMISRVWVEMLTFAASRSGWKEHARVLTRGGELLTHVCLLMAHLGLNEQCLPN